MKFSGTAAVVTGGASGLGQATAQRLAQAGAHVYVFDTANTANTANIATPETGITYVAGDVTDAGSVAAFLHSIQEPITVVVNCAGIAPAKRILGGKGVHDLETFQRTININLVGTFNVLRLAAERMAAQDPIDASGQRGVIINTASVAAYEGQIGQIAYAASKGGVVAMTITAARDLARNGIRVNTIAPGIVNTPLLQALGETVIESLAATVPFPQRLATPDEFAQLVEMVIHHDYLNGETIRMDGALRMGPQ